MKLVTSTIAIAFCLFLPLFPSAATPGAAAAADPRAADAAYAPAAEVKRAAATLGMPRLKEVTRAADHKYRVALASTSDANQALTPAQCAVVADVDTIFSMLATIAQSPEFQGHDPLYVLDRAREQLQYHKDYERLKGIWYGARDIIKPRLDSLGLLEKFLIREWCGASPGPRVIPGMSQAETIQHENFLFMSRGTSRLRIKQEINALYEANVQKNIQAFRAKLRSLYSDTARPVLKELWNIIVEYAANHQTQWGCSLEQAYAIHQKLRGDVDHQDDVLDLSDFGIITTRGLKGRHFRQVNLRGNFIPALPRAAFEFTADGIDLSHNPIESVAPRAFINQTQLDELHLDHTAISQLNAGAFAGLHFLEELNLSKCGLEQVAPEVFDELYCLQALHILDGNNAVIPHQYLKKHCCMPFLAKRFIDAYCQQTSDDRDRARGEALYYIHDKPVYISPCRLLEHLRHLDKQDPVRSTEFEGLFDQAVTILTAIHIAREEYDQWAPVGPRVAPLRAAVLAAKRNRNQQLPAIIAEMKSIVDGPAATPLLLDDAPTSPLLSPSDKDSNRCCTIS